MLMRDPPVCLMPPFGHTGPQEGRHGSLGRVMLPGRGCYMGEEVTDRGGGGVRHDMPVCRKGGRVRHKPRDPSFRIWREPTLLIPSVTDKHAAWSEPHHSLNTRCFHVILISLKLKGIPTGTAYITRCRHRLS